jgi:hypothetical protein
MTEVSRRLKIEDLREARRGRAVRCFKFQSSILTLPPRARWLSQRQKKRLAPGGASRGLWGSDPGSGVNGSECAGKVGVAVAHKALTHSLAATTHPSLADKPHFTVRQPITDEIGFREVRAEADGKILHTSETRKSGQKTRWRVRVLGKRSQVSRHAGQSAARELRTSPPSFS